MAEDVRHVMQTDPATEQVFCMYMYNVVKFDGPFVAKTCWSCPFWGGLADGYGVECIYDDPNANSQVVKYTKPSAAQAEAPEKPDDMDGIAAQNGIAARDARIALIPQGEEAQAEEQAPEQGAPEGEQAQPAETQMPAKSAKGQQVAPGGPAPAPTPGAAAQQGKRPVPPQFKKKKAPVAPVAPMKSATISEVTSEVLKTLFKRK